MCGVIGSNAEGIRQLEEDDRGKGFADGADLEEGAPGRRGCRFGCQRAPGAEGEGAIAIGDGEGVGRPAVFGDELGGVAIEERCHLREDIRHASPPEG
jgi:hypothetical protein